MNQLTTVWNTLPLGRRITVIGATMAMFATILMLSNIASRPSMTLLFAGLESSQAGDVVRSLEQRGEQFDIRNGAIYVDSSRRDELRMTLAADGLPTNGAAGYELLDSLSGFGTTSEMFNAAYWRAIEGELARTVVSGPQFRSARIHISNQKTRSLRQRSEPSASVSVVPNSGSISAESARGLRHLVASAVAGLRIENVSVINGLNGNVIPHSDGVGGFSSASTRSADLKLAVERLIEARVGPGNTVVEVSVENVTESQSIVERSFDPDSRVVISTDTEENTQSAENAGASGVTVASNLPNGDTGADQNGNKSRNNRTRERVNFEVSETQREITRNAGAIKRLTVAVIVNGVRVVNDSGVEIIEPRGDEEIASLRELVASAVGFDESRGDVIIIKSMSFQPPVLAGTEVEKSLLDLSSINLMAVIQIVSLGIISLLLGLFVVRPILTNGKPGGLPALGPPVAASENGMVGNATAIDIANKMGTPVASEPVHDGLVNITQSNPEFGGSLQIEGSPQSDTVGRLRDLIADRQDETVEVLRSWMEDKEGSA